jgi:hypothetical protein
MSMKKIFIVTSVLMALAFIAGPSHALIGVEDPVTGNAFRVPFIVALGATGLDTLVMYQETSGNAALFGTGLAAQPQRGVLAWIIWSPRSVHVGDGTRIFTRGDVDAMSMRDLILNFVGTSGQAQLLIDLDGDGVNDHYYGYMTCTEASTLVGNPGINNLFAYVQFVDLAAGQAAGTIGTMYELANVAGGFTGGGYLINQCSVSSAGGVANALNFDHSAINGVTGGTWEVMSPWAYVTSYWRERALAVAAPVFIRFTPRWYLHNATGQSYIFIYKGQNHSPATVNVRFWDNNEFNLSGAISLPNEMNLINMRLTLPAAMMAAYPAAGWIDIRNPDILGGQLRWGATVPVVGNTPNWEEIEWTCWVWNTAASAAASLNWSALWVDKEVGT